MKIICYTTSYWNTESEAAIRCLGGVLPWDRDPRTFAPNFTHASAYKGHFSLDRTLTSMQEWLNPDHVFVACGTWSDPKHSRLPSDIPIINAGVEPDRESTTLWNYSACAFTAAAAYILNRRDWDLAIHITDDIVAGLIDWDSLLREFVGRPETVLATQWGPGRMDWPIAMKRDAVSAFLHRRRRANLVESKNPDWLYPELELEISAIYRGKWWNPWPHVPTIRRDFGVPGAPAIDDEITMTWPFVRLPNPDWIQRYGVIGKLRKDQ
jgi:hypothetical protein